MAPITWTPECLGPDPGRRWTEARGAGGWEQWWDRARETLLTGQLLGQKKAQSLFVTGCSHRPTSFNLLLLSLAVFERDPGMYTSLKMGPLFIPGSLKAIQQHIRN